METQTIKSNGSTGAGTVTVSAIARTPEDAAMSAARRKFTAAVELLMSFDPTADQLDACARAIVKIAHKGINPRKGSEDA